MIGVPLCLKLRNEQSNRFGEVIMPIQVVRNFWNKRNREPQALLNRLVEINSQSSYVRGVNKIQYLFASQLKHLGFQCLFLNNSVSKSGRLLFARRHCGVKNAPLITLVCHSDTVNTNDQRRRIICETKGSRLIGPGVLDDKSGMVTLLEFLKLYITEDPPQFDLAVVSSPNEEIGSPGFTEIFHNVGRRSFLVIGFEPGTSSGHVISRRNGNRWYKILIKGKGGHAGRFEPGKVNALHELSCKISRLHELNDFKRQMSINLSRVETESRSYNTISDVATAYIDVRFSNLADRAYIHDRLMEVLNSQNVFCPATQMACDATYEIEDDCPPLAQNQKATVYLDMFRESYRDLWKEDIHEVASEGASDLNYFSHQDNVVFDGLGGVGGRMHCVDEWVEVDSISKRARALGAFFKELQFFVHRGGEQYVGKRES